MTKQQIAKRNDFNAMLEAASDERIRFNKAIQGGKVAILQTAFGAYKVLSVDAEFWYHTIPADRPNSFGSERSFCGCNDGTWSNLLQQVNEPRNARWA